MPISVGVLWKGVGGANIVWDVSKCRGGGWVQHSKGMVSEERCASVGVALEGRGWGQSQCGICQRGGRMGPAHCRCGFRGERVGPSVWVGPWRGQGGANPVCQKVERMGQTQCRHGLRGERVGPRVWAWPWREEGGANPVRDLSERREGMDPAQYR